MLMHTVSAKVQVSMDIIVARPFTKTVVERLSCIILPVTNYCRISLGLYACFQVQLGKRNTVVRATFLLQTNLELVPAKHFAPYNRSTMYNINI
jgi:hypothetical protein